MIGERSNEAEAIGGIVCAIKPGGIVSVHGTELRLSIAVEYSSSYGTHSGDQGRIHEVIVLLVLMLVSLCEQQPTLIHESFHRR